MGKRKKTSVFYTKYSDKEIAELVRTTIQVGELVKMHDMQNQGSNSATLRRRLDSLGIDYSHWVANKGLSPNVNRLPNDSLFTDDGVARTSTVKRRILREGLLENKCNICHAEPIWESEPLVLILDHIDGNNTNNTLTNLQLVCPNCNSQLSTHAGRNTKQAKQGPKGTLCSCGKKKYRTSKQCLACSKKK